jgi:hypothetical protein
MGIQQPDRILLVVGAALAAMMICSSMSSAQVHIQTSPQVRVKDTVRVWSARMNLHRAEGILLRMDGALLDVGIGGRPSIAPSSRIQAPLADVERLEVLRGKARSPGRIAIGVLIGAVAGAALGSAIGPMIECRGSCDDEYYGGVIGQLAGGALGIILGGTAGGLVGARAQPNWEAVHWRP